MTIALAPLMQLADRAMSGVPHVNASETLMLMRYLTDTQREHAQLCYAALIGERTLPVDVQPTKAKVSIKSSRPPKSVPMNRERMNAAAAARRRLEEMRDLENV